MDRSNIFIHYWVRTRGELPDRGEDGERRASALVRWALIVVGVMLAGGIVFVVLRAALAMMPAQVIRESLVSWIGTGYVYILQPRTPEATLSVLLGVAAATL
jgi:hypothetical protein